MKTFLKGLFTFIFSAGIMLFVFGWFFYWGNQDKLVKPVQGSYITNDTYDINYHSLGKLYNNENINLGTKNGEDIYVTVSFPGNNVYLERIDFDIKGEVYYSAYDSSNNLTSEILDTEYFARYFYIEEFAIGFNAKNLTNSEKEKEFRIHANSIYFEKISYVKPIDQWNEYSNLYINDLTLHSRVVSTNEYFNIKNLDFWSSQNKDYLGTNKFKASFKLEYISANNSDFSMKNDETQQGYINNENGEFAYHDGEYLDFDFYKTIFIK